MCVIPIKCIKKFWRLFGAKIMLQKTRWKCTCCRHFCVTLSLPKILGLFPENLDPLTIHKKILFKIMVWGNVVHHDIKNDEISSFQKLSYFVKLTSWWFSLPIQFFSSFEDRFMERALQINSSLDFHQMSLGSWEMNSPPLRKKFLL